jgi:UDP-2,3-diacylglucosamine pyrophosphatase LpxH
MQRQTPWLTRTGDWFAGLLEITCMLLEIFRHPDLRGSLALAIKRRLKGAVGYTRTFERSAAAFARERGMDGVICGHVHHPAVIQLGGVLYHNDGDWVQNCTALVEHADGTLELLRPEAVRSSAAA